MRKTLTISAVSFLACFSATTIFASGVPVQQNLNEFKLRPVMNAWGLVGNHAVGIGEAMAPIFGDEAQVFYGLVEGKIAKADNGWLLGGGFGYRKIYSDVLWGAYAILDYDQSPLKHKFFVANPGLEALTTNWDFRVNGYFPFSNKNWSQTDSRYAFAGDIGDYNYVRYQVHSKFDRLVNLTTTAKEQAGLGFDGEVGRTIPWIKDLKAYVGGYYFNTCDLGSVTGFSGRVTYQITNYLGLEAVDTYDNNKKNTFMGGIKLTVGGFNKAEKDQFGLSGRLLDPIEHNIATIDNGYAAPVLERHDIIGVTVADQETLLGNNYWFFKPLNASNYDGDGTFENPYVGFEQAMVDNIVAVDPGGANLYFAPGTYSLENFISHYPGQPGSTNKGIFNVPGNFVISGRNDATYVQPAVGDNRALFIGGFDLYNNNITLDSIRFQNYQDFTPWYLDNALRIASVHDINLNNVEIGLPGSAFGTGGYYIAIKAQNSYNINLMNSTIHAYHEGIRAYNAVIMNFYDNNIISVVDDHSNEADALDFRYSSIANFIGNNNQIKALSFFEEAESVYLYQASLIINGQGNNFSATADNSNAYVMQAYTGSRIEINGNHNTFSSTSSAAANYAKGILINGSYLNIAGNNNVLTAQDSYAAYTLDIEDESNAIISGNYNTIVANGTNSATGVNLYLDSVLSITGNNNVINATATDSGGSYAYGVYIGYVSDYGNYFNITGNGNVINSDAVTDAYGIWHNGNVANIIELSGAGTIINVGMNSNPGFAAGIYIDNNASLFTPENLRVKNTTFNINGSDAWGINFASGSLDPAFQNDLINNFGNVFNGVAPDHRVGS